MSGLAQKLRNSIARKRKEIEELTRNLHEVEGDSIDLAPVPLESFLKERNADFRWLFGGVIAEGSVGMFVADPSVGKTTALVQMTLSLAAGKDVFGMRVGEASPTLYVAAEGSRAAFQNRVETARRSLEITETAKWFVHTQGMTDYKIGSVGLDRMIRQSGAKFIVLDTLGYFHSGDENDANDWKRHVMIPLRELIAKYGCTFCIVHHQGKSAEGRAGWRKGRGTSAMFGDCDFWLRMEAVVEGDTMTNQRVLFQDKNKYGLMGTKWSLEFDGFNAVLREATRPVAA